MDSQELHPPLWVSELRREMEQRECRYMDRMEAIERTLEVAVRTAKLAVDKAEVGANERFEAANNVKTEMGTQLAALMPRQEVTTRIEAVEGSIDALTQAVSRMTGRGTGIKDGFGYLVGAAGLGAFLVSVLVK